MFSSDLKPAVRNQLFHVSDILPTIANIAGFKIDKNIDGIDQWEMMSSGIANPRKEIPNIDDVFGFGSLIHKNYKFVNGTLQNGKLDSWLSERNPTPRDSDISYGAKVLTSQTNYALMMKRDRNLFLNYNRMFQMRKLSRVSCSRSNQKVQCDLTKNACLFDIFEDPCEQNNLADSHPNEFALMKQLYFDKLNEIVPSIRVREDSRCDPLNFNNTWSWWQDEL